MAKPLHKIAHHARRTVHSVRAKPYEVRMHVIRFLTIGVGFLVVVLWITLLKHQLQIDPIQKKQEIEKSSIISEGIWRVYDKTKKTHESD